MRWGILAASAALLFAFPANALAAPANDDFADREALTGVLPITATGSNVEATKEAGEPDWGLEEPAGHSVWYSWKAGSTGWVTIGTCGSGFGSLADVFTGSSYAALESVAGWNEGPDEDCSPAGSEATIHAVEGTTYAIRVDGNLSPMALPSKEGPIALEIASTPSPANDDFADARPVTAESLGGGTFYRVDVSGFNWNATKEVGEPMHGGDVGGASVWYSWTAPATGEAHARAVGGALEPLIGAYTGESVGALTPVAVSQPSPSELSVPVVAGTTYKFAVDGRFESGSGMATMGHLTFLVYLEVPLLDTPASNPPAAPVVVDATAPNTTIFRRTVRSAKHSATFAFRADGGSASFLCKLDGRRETKCHSPRVFVGLAPGRHTFRVRAVDAAGNADPTPAVAHFSVARPQHRHR